MGTGRSAPLGLWYRGQLGDGIPAPDRCVAVTGSRDSTSYGAAVTGEIAYSLAQRGITVLGRPPYGVDAHAHRAALADVRRRARPPSPSSPAGLTGTTRPETPTSRPPSAPTD
jgi:hypothetical protein